MVGCFLKVHILLFFPVFKAKSISLNARRPLSEVFPSTVKIQRSPITTKVFVLVIRHVTGDMAPAKAAFTADYLADKSTYTCIYR